MRDNLTTGFHIGEDICPTGVNRLFGSPINNRAVSGCCRRNAAKNAVLLVGVLKFVNHRHRKTGTDRAGERHHSRWTAPRPGGSSMSSNPSSPGDVFRARRLWRISVMARVIIRSLSVNGIRKQRINRHKRGMLRHNAVGFGSLGQKAAAKIFPVRRKLVNPASPPGPER